MRRQENARRRKCRWPASRRATRAPGNAVQPGLMERAVRLAKREGASAVRITRRGSIVIELLPCAHARVRQGPAMSNAAACGATPTSASTGAGAAPAPRRRQGGSASRRARSAARLRDYVDAKKVHEKRRLTLLRLDLLVHPLDGDELRLPAQAAQTCLARERHLCEQPRLGQVANRRVEHPVPSRVLEGATAGQHRPDPGLARRLAAASPEYRTSVVIYDRDLALGGAWAALRARYRARDAKVNIVRPPRCATTRQVAPGCVCYARMTSAAPLASSADRDRAPRCSHHRYIAFSQLLRTS